MFTFDDCDFFAPYMSVRNPKLVISGVGFAPSLGGPPLSRFATWDEEEEVWKQII